MLDFSQIEAGKLEIRPEEFDLCRRFHKILKTYAPEARRRGLELIWDEPEGFPERVVGDAGRLEQILINLLGNALKFTDQGEIELRLRLYPSEATDSAFKIECSVRDTGTGIPPEKQEQIFRAFEQADLSMTRRHGGVGLGLSIASRLVAAMDGRIWVESRPGQGSTFYFTARLGALGSATRSFPRPAELCGRTALVAVGNAAWRRVLAGQLRTLGIRVVTADGTAELASQVEALRHLPDETHLAFVDTALSMADGRPVAEWLAGTAGDLTCRVVLLTPPGERRSSERDCDSDLRTVLTTPVSREELLEAALHAVASTPAKLLAISEETERTRRLADTGQATASGGPGLRILLAEDNKINQRVASCLLERNGHTTMVAANGQEALEMLNRERFDLILMDVQMPVLDGLTAATEIRRRERGTGNRIPIVALTAHAYESDRERCISAGMDAFLPKPIDPRQLSSVIEALTCARVSEPPLAATARP